MPSQKETHSPMGGSSFDRGKECPGSVSLISELLPAELEREETEHSKEGTAAHELAAVCLDEGLEPWERVHILGQAITDAVTVYVDHCRPLMEGADFHLIEYSFSNPDVHPWFKGTVDFTALKEGTLYVRDYKNGRTTVEATSGQLRYYAYAMLLLHPEARRVSVGVVQPNGFHTDGPIRTWEFPADDLHEWATDILVPAMLRAEADRTLKAGDHCRFCPLSIACPVLQGMFRAAVIAPVGQISRLTDAQLNDECRMMAAVEIYIRKLEEERYHRLMNGRVLPDWELVHKKANRVWKPKSQEVFFTQYGKDAFTEPEFKSPNAMEKLGPAAKELVKKWAYKPQPDETEATVAPAGSGRPRYNVKGMAEKFADVEEF